ncbi:Beige/BEACH domain containing protein [Trichomonas vaginalis G3]|uniref:Beige/BEACH domain containing protein n=1 Tax=Trichomonas vaginalis (strain ATCC PRA-98 / G3) TaxID=412133 RepID=A2F7W3_TRIV3|nr:aggrephagy protein [Trichomonas vaginalis G3]EAX99005.1 Beige/BEACH domain containing protein [Trichomonas vaginalis G3]KAI5492270.1 aggrephagy protein [Trichomonas vaginalis G3]|eukprot:XP_001311935.1 Beige/BEACH domain containing protein [Trichomonas vaginalis G3]
MGIYEAGPRSDPPLFEDTILCARTTIRQNELAFIESEKNFGVSMDYSYKDKETLVSFSEILGQMCKVEFLLPLFNNLDCKIVDNKVSYEGLIIDVFSSTLSMSSEAQKFFAEADGFHIISHLLMTCDMKHINYELYLHFTAMLECLKEDLLITELLDAILLNLSLWSRSDGISHTRILKHWARALFTSYSSYFHQLRPMKQLLTIMKLYYGPSLNKIKIAENVNINDCLRAIEYIILQMAIEFGVTDNEFLFLIGITITPNSPTKEFLHIIGELLQIKPCPMKEDFTNDSLSLLMLTFSFNDENIISMVFEILFIAQQNNLFKEITVQDHINIILSQMTHDIVRESLFSTLTEMMINGFFELLPIVCWLAINLGQTFIIKLSDKLVPDPKYCLESTWFFWPMILIINSPASCIDKLFNFLIFSNIENIAETIENIYESIDVIAESLGIQETSNLKCKFLHIIADYLLNNVCRKDLIHSFFKIVEEFIFYDNDNKALSTLTLFSPFEKSVLRRKRSMTTQDVSKESYFMNFRQKSGKSMWMTPNEVTNLIRNNQRKQSETKMKMFSLRIAADGDWQDHDLAEKCLRLFQRWNSQDFISFDILLCVFLVPYYYDIVKSHFLKLNLSQSVLSDNIPLFALLNMKCAENSHPLLFRLPESTMNEASKAIDEFVKKSEMTTQTNDSFVLLKMWQSNTNTIHEKSNKVLSLLDIKAISMCSNQERNFIFKLQKNRRESEKLWTRLWRNLTIDGAPWTIANKIETKIALKRDNSLCSFGCPSRLKRDWPKYKYDDIPQLQFKAIAKNEFLCEIVNCFSVTKAIFFIQNSIFLRKEEGSLREWPFDTIKYVIQHKNIRNKKAIEFFFKDKKTKLLCFNDDDYSIVFNTLKSNKLTIQNTNVNVFTKLWQQHQISTFDYLMHLNRLSGRTFNDLEHYPLMPFLINDFGKIFELEKSEFLRDLRKPMSQLGENRILEIMSEFKKQGPENFHLNASQLSPDDVRNDLSRLSPFSHEKPFKSYEEIYKNSTESMNSFSELPAEFYFLPEAFISSTKGNLIFPEWCNNSAFEFVYLNRKTLESEIVSKNISRWIDLIWGPLQQGVGAIPAFNLFKPEIYSQNPKSDTNSKSDSGYSPLKLFNDLHPIREQKKKTNSLVKNQIVLQIVSDSIVFTCCRKSKSNSNSYHIITLDECGKITDSMVDFIQIVKHVNKEMNSNSIIPKSNSKRITFGNLSQSIANIKQAAQIASQIESQNSFSKFKSNQNDTIVSSFSFDKLQDFDRSSSMSNLAGSFLNANTQLRRSSFNPTGSGMSCPSTVLFQIDDFSRIITKKKEGKFAELNDCSTICFVNAGNVTYVNNGKLQTMKTNIQDVTLISANKNWFVTANRGCVLTFYKQENPLSTEMKYIFSIPLYRDSVMCVSISRSFGLAACGTRDGFLFFISLSRGTSFATVDLGEQSRPCKILVTHQWGFVVVYMTVLQKGILNHVIAVYSPNGNLIRQRSIASAISSWSCYKSNDGFDYIIAADDKGRIYKFEAFYLNIDEQIYRCSCEVPFVTYLPEQGGVLAVTVDGRIIFAPCY